MATWRIWPAASGAAAAADTAAYSLSTEFAVTQAGCSITGYWWWCPAGGATGAKTFTLWSVITGTTGTQITAANATSGTNTAGAWNFTACTPTALTSGQHYRVIVTYAGGANWYSSANSIWTADIVNGPLTAFSTANATGNFQGAYHQVGGSTPFFTDTTTGNQTSYYIDVQVDDGVTGGSGLVPQQARAMRRQRRYGRPYARQQPWPYSADAGLAAGTATLVVNTSVTAPAAQLAPATLLPAAAITAPATELPAAATLAETTAVSAPVVTQLAPATLAAGTVVAAPVSTQLAPAALAVAWSVAAPSVLIENVTTTLAVAWALASPAVQLAPATLQAGFAVTSPAVQMAPAALAAGFAVSIPAVTLIVPATLAAAWSVSATVIQLAPAALAAAFIMGSPNIALAVPASMIVTGSLTGSAGQGASLAAGFSIISPAQQLAVASLTAQAALNTPAAAQQAAATLAAAFMLSAAPPPVAGAAVLQAQWVMTATGIMVPALVIAGLRAGEPHLAWDSGEPHLAWAAGEAHLAWAAGEAHATRYAAGNPHSAWAAGEPHS